MRELLVFLLVFSNCAYGLKHFHLGRSQGGNLGIPHIPILSLDSLPEDQWFEQKLDHFNPTDERTWKQRFFMNGQFYDSNSSTSLIFLMVGGEGPASAHWMVSGTWIQYAKHFKAMCLQLEHRYYGDSHPTPDLSVKNLQYLSSEQALADLAEFIVGMNEKMKWANPKWVLFGGSYPGSLVAWARVSYPHLVYAGVSSSGPLRAKLDFMEYFQVVVNALREKTGSEECVEVVKRAVRQVEMMIEMHPDTIEREFKVCSPFSSAASRDMDNFFDWIANDFADLVQYNEDNRNMGNEKYRNLTINNVCAMLTEKKTDTAAYEKLAAYHAMVLEKNGETCMDYSYDSMVKELSEFDWDKNRGGARQWLYQTCTEFGFYQTSSRTVEIFGDHFNLDFYVQQCVHVFGERYNKKFIQNAVNWSNSKYGSTDLQVTRVVFVQGSVDPWHALGITHTRDSDVPAIYIKGTAHCANMYPASPKDSEQLIEARLEVQQYLEGWLGLP